MWMLLKPRIHAAAIVAVLVLTGCTARETPPANVPNQSLTTSRHSKKSHKPCVLCRPTTSSNAPWRITRNERDDLRFCP